MKWRKVRVNRHGKDKTQTFSATEKYVWQRIFLVGDGNSVTILEPGTLVYPFQFVLPTNLPSSFTNRSGTIAYFLDVEVQRSTVIKILTSLPFTVNGILDLNLEPKAANPQEGEGHKGSNYFLLRKGEMDFILTLPRSGFVPGEILDFTGEISNNSNKKILGLRACLLQKLSFRAQGHIKKEKRYFCEVEGPGVDKGDHKIWKPQPGLKIPPVPPTRLGGTCRIINVQYFLKFQVLLSGFSTSLKCLLPVLIGNIPLRSTFELFRPPGSFMSSVAPCASIQGEGEIGSDYPEFRALNTYAFKHFRSDYRGIVHF